MVRPVSKSETKYSFCFSIYAYICGAIYYIVEKQRYIYFFISLFCALIKRLYI